MKKFATMAISILLIACLVAGGSLAYLSDTASDVNVMTLGNVEIEQIEQQRPLDENGNPKAEALTDFRNDKGMLPAVIVANGYDSTVTLDNGNTQEIWDANINGEVDKIVTVKNSGKTDAYVRTLFAFEDKVLKDGSYLTEQIHTLWGASGIVEWLVADDGSYPMITKDDVTYTVCAFTYSDKLVAGQSSNASLVQMWLDPSANNEFAEIAGDEYKVIALSQAVQIEGFNSAEAALTAGFGEFTQENAQLWFDGVNASDADTWDGTADTSWYNDTDTEFVIETAEQLAGLAELVDGGNNFAGKTVKLGQNIDLYCEDENGNKIGFNPIGHSSNGKSFNGTFDGQGYTVSNMYEQSDLGAWQYEGEYYGLFAYTNGATIKNVTIADAYISSGRNEAAGVVGNAVDTTFSDITISNTTLIAYNNSAGGVASECYGTCSFTNITVDEDTVIGPLWGTYDVRLGGVVGLVHAGNNVSFSNVNVACKLDAINDVAANYQYWLYRYSGMLIGHVDGVNGVADPTGYVTCENVTVTYGDWVNYHYCEDADLGAGSYNGPGEYKYARVEAGTGTDGIDLSTCNHNADESHNVLIVFDQLFGGGQGVKGLKTYDGVTVVYP
ncbi:MAG: hypothetical protein IJA90_10500 [Peptococcaceae bacterium]|nr:hypothetical protein [Peptococcaceae bacterium]